MVIKLKREFMEYWKFEGLKYIYDHGFLNTPFINFTFNFLKSIN